MVSGHLRYYVVHPVTQHTFQLCGQESFTQTILQGMMPLYPVLQQLEKNINLL